MFQRRSTAKLGLIAQLATDSSSSSIHSKPFLRMQKPRSQTISGDRHLRQVPRRGVFKCPRDVSENVAAQGISTHANS